MESKHPVLRYSKSVPLILNHENVKWQYSTNFKRCTSKQPILCWGCTKVVPAGTAFYLGKKSKPLEDITISQDNFCCQNCYLKEIGGDLQKWKCK
jgi:hypothetical protein